MPRVFNWLQHTQSKWKKTKPIYFTHNFVSVQLNSIHIEFHKAEEWASDGKKAWLDSQAWESRVIVCQWVQQIDRM